MGKVSRRDMWGSSSLMVASWGCGLPLVGASSDPGGRDRKLEVAVAGAHPDDPESGCGSTIAMYSDQGHEVRHDTRVVAR